MKDPAHHAWSKRERSYQAVGRRGAATTKVHALTDAIGRPYALMLTAGNVSDIKTAPALIERAGRMRYLLVDKGYDADRLRWSLRKVGAFGPVFRSSTVALLRHFATVFGLIPNSRLRVASEAYDRCIAARTACVVVAHP